MTDDEIKKWVETLDESIPKDGAKVLIEYAAKGCEVTANRAGYLRLGIEILKAAIVPLGDGRMFTPISIEYLTSWQKAGAVERFSRREDMEVTPRPPRVSTWKNKILAIGCLTIVLFFVICALVGFGSLVTFIIH